MKPQTAAVLRLMERHPEGITSGDALAECGTSRLAARIAELKADGHRVRTTSVHVGPQRARVALYQLVREPAPMRGVQSSLFDSPVTAAPSPRAAVSRAPTGARQ